MEKNEGLDRHGYSLVFKCHIYVSMDWFTYGGPIKTKSLEISFFDTSLGFVVL